MEEYCPELIDGPVPGRHHWVLQDVLETQADAGQISQVMIFVCTECGKNKFEEKSLSYGLIDKIQSMKKEE